MATDGSTDSPFPGMDPYLESPIVWEDFHYRFINTLADAITERLPPQYVAAIGEHLSLLGSDDPEATVIPDVAVLVGRAGPARTITAAAVIDRPPVTLRNRRVSDPEVQLYIELRAGPDQRAVTVIEVLSPKNKRGDGHAVYIDKRNAVLDTSVSLVEIDLLHGGRRIDLAEPLPAGDCFAYVSRGDRRPFCDVFAWTVRDPLPTLPVPLRPGEPELNVGLDGPFGQAYRRGRFRQRVPYADTPPPPAWAADDAAWVAAITDPITRPDWTP